MSESIRFYAGDIIRMTQNNILVFGSNTQGRHGFGMALLARDYCGAKYGQARGLQGNAYAIVTKNLEKDYEDPATGIIYRRYGVRSIPLSTIRESVEELYVFARENPKLKFFIGYKNNSKNLNGFESSSFISLFVRNIDVPPNIRFHNSFRELFKTWSIN